MIFSKLTLKIIPCNKIYNNSKYNNYKCVFLYFKLIKESMDTPLNERADNIKTLDELKPGTLYLVSTPIGNNDDITLRAIKTLNHCDLVVCEEMKEGARILKKLNISKKLDTLNEQNEEEKSNELIQLLKKGKNISLISDAGTPVLADPGSYLVKEALRLNIPITVIPGVSSVTTALVRCGFSIKQFLFAGFLSRNSSERIAQLRRLSSETRTVVLLETPYRLIPLLEAAAQIMPDRKAYLGINLTMPFETHHYGTFKKLFEKFNSQKFRGEFVICFEGASFEEIITDRSHTKRYFKNDRFKKKKY